MLKKKEKKKQKETKRKTKRNKKKQKMKKLCDTLRHGWINSEKTRRSCYVILGPCFCR